jgi:aminoglycoside phosphotransferase (APT) family kinase protein
VQTVFWAIYRWIDGQPYREDLVHDQRQAAADLAQFVVELRLLDPLAAPPGGRKPLRELDAPTRLAIEASRNVIDSDAAIAAWESALEAPAWDGTPVWIRTDLLRPNLLVDRGRLCAVIDFGGVGVGDPAADVIAAMDEDPPSAPPRPPTPHSSAGVVASGEWGNVRVVPDGALANIISMSCNSRER